MHPHDLPRLLLDAGFEDGGDEPAMAAQLAALADVPMATELQVTPVEDSSALDEYRQVLAAGFGEGPKEADWVASVLAIIGLEPHNRWRHYVGTVAGDPVAIPDLLCRTWFLALRIAEILRDQAGYATMMVGKWHLAKDSDCSAAGPQHSWPCQRGFDRFYGVPRRVHEPAPPAPARRGQPPGRGRPATPTTTTSPTTSPTGRSR